MGKKIAGTRNMRLLELFSGTGSVGAAFKARGWDVVSVDLDPAGGPTIVADINTWEGVSKMGGH